MVGTVFLIQCIGGKIRQLCIKKLSLNWAEPLEREKGRKEMRNKFGLSNFENTHTYTHTYSNYSTENICYTFSITIIMTYLPTNHQTFSTWKVIKCLNEAVQILLVQNQQKNHSGKVEYIIKSTLCSIPKVDFILILQINLFFYEMRVGVIWRLFY